MQRKTVELIVGLFVAAGLLALVMLAFKVANLSSTTINGGYTLSARFDNIGGLKSRAPVTISGVRVGRVASISVDPQSFQAVVMLDIAGKYNNLPVDTGASILTSGLLGEQYVALEPGGSPDHLKNGDQIKMTQSALILEQVIGQVLFSKAQESKGGGQQGR